mmetsp:Transcript_40905/g.63857  ORF Transcript_40905/g.63857 Transcript_40905/m.63857 type:complete len:199 (+) Transcript_40905:71-667(+)
MDDNKVHGLVLQWLAERGYTLALAALKEESRSIAEMPETGGQLCSLLYEHAELKLSLEVGSESVFEEMRRAAEEEIRDLPEELEVLLEVIHELGCQISVLGILEQLHLLHAISRSPDRYHSTTIRPSAPCTQETSLHANSMRIALYSHQAHQIAASRLLTCLPERHFRPPLHMLLPFWLLLFAPASRQYCCRPPWTEA